MAGEGERRAMAGRPAWPGQATAVGGTRGQTNHILGSCVEVSRFWAEVLTMSVRIQNARAPQLPQIWLVLRKEIVRTSKTLEKV